MTLQINALRKGISTHHLQTRKLPEDTYSILIGIPTRDPRLGRGRLSPEFVWGLLQMQRPTNLNFRYECEWRGESVTENRQIITERAIESGAKYLVLFDDDMILPINTLPQLITSLETLEDAAIVTGVIGKKDATGEPTIFKEWNNGSYWNWKKGIIEPIWACGAACMAINLDYVRQIKSPYWLDETLIYKNSHTEFSEDLNFCRKITEETGGKIYLDTNVVCGHLDIKTGEVYWPKSKENTVKEFNMYEANQTKKSEQTVLLVVGVGRTGTSTTARILQEHFDIPMSFEKANEFYEDILCKNLNNNLISGNFSFSYYLAHLEEYIRIRNEQQVLWGFKDPRLCYTLGIFLSLIQNPIIIRCNRSKEKVIPSLMKSYNWTEEKAIQVYDDRSKRLDNILDNRNHLVLDFSEHRTDQDIIDELNKLF